MTRLKEQARGVSASGRQRQVSNEGVYSQLRKLEREGAVKSLGKGFYALSQRDGSPQPTAPAALLRTRGDARIRELSKA